MCAHRRNAAPQTDGLWHALMTAEIRALQVDNQFDGGTPFPVVLSIEPSSGPAMRLQVLQTFDDEEQGSPRFYAMLSLEVGEGMPSPRACSASSCKYL